MQYKAQTVEEYLAQLPPDRRDALQQVRAVMLKNLPKGYEEGIQYGMIGYYVPFSIYPAGYHCDTRQPLPFAGLASQKNHMALYLMCHYGDPELDAWFRSEWAKTGKKLDMGKSCVRFKRIEDVALDVIAKSLKRAPVKKYIEHYENLIMSATTKRKVAAAKKKTTSAKKQTKAASSKTTRKTVTKSSKRKASPKATKRKASNKSARRRAR